MTTDSPTGGKPNWSIEDASSSWWVLVWTEAGPYREVKESVAITHLGVPQHPSSIAHDPKSGWLRDELGLFLCRGFCWLLIWRSAWCNVFKSAYEDILKIIKIKQHSKELRLPSLGDRSRHAYCYRILTLVCKSRSIATRRLSIRQTWLDQSKIIMLLFSTISLSTSLLSIFFVSGIWLLGGKPLTVAWHLAVQVLVTALSLRIGLGSCIHSQ